MEKNKEEELKAYFKFLCSGDKNFKCDDNKKFKVSDLIFGLDCYGNAIDRKKKEQLIDLLIKKGESYEIDFDEFLDLFQFKKSIKLQKLDQDERKKISRQMFFLIYQLLGIDDESKKLDRMDIKKLFYIIFNLDESHKEKKKEKDTNGNTLISINTKNQKDKTLLFNKMSINNPTPTTEGGGNFIFNLKEKFDNTNSEFIDDLIKSIDYDEDGKISLKDFDFLLENYFNDM
jgi:hypothetical protein